MKKLVAGLLALSIVFGTAGTFTTSPKPLFAVDAAAEETQELPMSGKCGENLTWKIDKNGTLTISGTGKIENVTVDDPDSGVDADPWSRNEKIKKVIIKDGVTDINGYAFTDCTSLTEVTIPDTVMSIGEGAFLGCTALVAITIPSGLTDIDDLVFCGTKWLENKKAENTLVVINGNLIDGTKCEGEVTIPDGVTKIGYEAFRECSDITSVTIPDSVKTIRPAAFQNCAKLETVNIPDSVTKIDGSSFEGTPWFEKKKEESDFVAVNGILLDGKKCKGDVIIPDGVKCIATGAFGMCGDLKSVKLPESVTCIDDYAFTNCPELKSVTIPASVTEISLTAFMFSGPEIHGVKNSAAEKFAAELGYKFIEIKEDDTRTLAKGDTNGDGEVNVTDIAVVAAHIKGIKALDQVRTKAADVDGNDVLNVTDIAMIASHIKGIKPLS